MKIRKLLIKIFMRGKPHITTPIEVTEAFRENKSCILSRSTTLLQTYNGLKRLLIDPIEGFML